MNHDPFKMHVFHHCWRACVCVFLLCSAAFVVKATVDWYGYWTLFSVIEWNRHYSTEYNNHFIVRNFCVMDDVLILWVFNWEICSSVRDAHRKNHLDKCQIGYIKLVSFTLWAGLLVDLTVQNHEFSLCFVQR